MNEISVVTHEISVLFLENCENCLFLLIFMNKRRLNVQNNVPDPCLKRMTMMTILKLLNMIQSWRHTAARSGRMVIELLSQECRQLRSPCHIGTM